MYQIPKQVSRAEIQEQEELRREREALSQQRALALEARQVLRDKAKQLDPLFQRVPSPDYIKDLPSEYQVIRQWHRLDEVTLPLEPVWEAWHGTSVDVVEQVSQQGLRARASRHKHLFGRGLYFTRDLRKALSHAAKHGKKIMVLLRCRVAMGKIAADDAVRYFKSRTGGTSRFGSSPRHEYNSLYCGAGTAVDHAWGGNVANEEFVVFDERQAVVEEIYLIQPRALVLPEPAKQRQGQRGRVENHRAKKERASAQEHIARHHLCVKNGEVCCWATVERARTRGSTISYRGRRISSRDRLSDRWLSLCARHENREVVSSPLHTIEEQKRFCTALCSLWVPHRT